VVHARRRRHDHPESVRPGRPRQINPSAIVVTLYLLSRPAAGPRVAVYIAAIFLTYFTAGLLALLGIDAFVSFLPSAGDLVDSLPGLAVQAAIGLALLAYSLRGSNDAGVAHAAAADPAAVATAIPAASARTYAALALLGVTVTVMELPTALPYFDAIAVITNDGLSIAQWLPLLVGYNVIFVLPPIALLLGHLFVEQQIRQRYAGFKERLERGARETASVIAGLVGGGLFITSAIELLARLR
jgi:hypothetical protein